MSEHQPTSLEVLESVRGAVCLVLDELNLGGSDICRYQEVADTCPTFTAVTIEGCGPVEPVTAHGRTAQFDIPIINGPTIRIMAFQLSRHDG